MLTYEQSIEEKNYLSLHFFVFTKFTFYTNICRFCYDFGCFGAHGPLLLMPEMSVCRLVCLPIPPPPKKDGWIRL